MKSYNLDAQQHATLIAALRFYQKAGQGEPSNRDDWTHDLATNGDTVVSLDEFGIDDLVDHLQQSGIERACSAGSDVTRSCEIHVQLMVRIPNHVDDEEEAAITLDMDPALIRICYGDGKPMEGATVEEYNTMEVFPDMDDDGGIPPDYECVSCGMPAKGVESIGAIYSDMCGECNDKA